LTNGHLDLIERAAGQFNHLVVGVILNPNKTPYFSVDERKEMIKAVTSHLKNTETDSFSGLLADYVNKNDFDVVIRGLRAATDFELEIQMAQMNARLYKKNVETIFLMTSPNCSFISSQMVKEVHLLGGDVAGLVPNKILQIMNEKRRNSTR
jgi:pantetheine-phosphate adenylyltransferase